MELKWLEDLVCVAQQGHFARAAEARHITQSALSRRIKSLELWAGAELLDRSQHPIRLTAAGREFYAAAREIIRQSYEARSVSEEMTRGSGNAVTVSSLHTLALYFVPNFISALVREVGPFEVSVVAETRTVDEYLTDLTEHNSDFFIAYAHRGMAVDVDTSAFERKVIGQDIVRPYIRRDLPDPQLDAAKGPPIPYLAYSGTALMSKLVRDLLDEAPFHDRLRTRYRASLAESIHTAVARGLGVGWLPLSTVEGRGGDESLRALEGPWETEISIEIYKSRTNSRAVVDMIWSALDRMPVQ